MTVRYVERCPEDLKSWEKAAKDMNCESIEHNCTHNLSKGDHRFEYHCVINTWINATLEVCALNRTIFGTLHKRFYRKETICCIMKYLYTHTFFSDSMCRAFIIGV